jgi:hypothetical protein
MRVKNMKKIVLILSMTVLLSACLPSSNTIQSTVDAGIDPKFPTVAANVPSVVPLPTNTLHPLTYLPPGVSPGPTEDKPTDLQPTITQEPDVTPTFTFFVKWTPDQVMAAFQAAGLEVGSPRPMTKNDYGSAPMVAIKAIHFLVPSVCDGCGGRILSFANANDQKLSADYYNNDDQSWVFIKDNILVQINGGLSNDKATLYETALNNLK